MRRRDLLVLASGVAALNTVGGFAQQQKLVMGVLGGGSPGPYAPFITALQIDPMLQCSARRFPVPKKFERNSR